MIILNKNTGELMCDGLTLQDVLALHKKWLNSEPGGVKADLSYVDLSCADLRSVDLSCSDLNGADLSYTDFRSVNFRAANLFNTDFRGADLNGADFRGADLNGADMRGADLNGADMRFYKSGRYNCYVNSETMQIECEKHSWDDWLSFSDKDIIEMDGRNALKWWRANKDILILIRESLKNNEH